MKTERKIILTFPETMQWDIFTTVKENKINLEFYIQSNIL